MARVKSGMTTKHRHKKVLKMAKGYYGSKHTLYKTAHEQVMKALVYAYRDRKVNKRNFRKLWITRINAACRMRDMSYSKFMDGLKKANIDMNRKVLSELAISDPKTFDELVILAKAALECKTVAAAAPKAATKEVEVSDLASNTLAELKEIAKEKGLTGYSKLKKAELIEALEA